MLEAIRSQISAHFAGLDDGARIAALNELRTFLAGLNPIQGHPVDLVLWLPAGQIKANDYNPNTVAPPEMQLLETSIVEDGYTQPIVTWPEADHKEVVDGFHRHRVGTESLIVRASTKGYLPVVTIRAERHDRSDRMASTIRHNRARGKHGIPAMTEIVSYLTKRNWTPAKIANELGMEADEVLRFQQVGGLAEAYARREYSRAWEA